MAGFGDRSAWSSYVAIGTVGYVIYGVGAVGPYLRDDLALSATLVGLHSTAMALGLVASGAVVAALDRRFGEPVVRAAVLMTLAAAVIALAAAPAVWVTLLGAGAIGFGAGTVLGYANAALAAPGGVAARLHLARANVWAMIAAFTCPVVLAVGVSSGPGWWLGLVPAPFLVAFLLIGLRAGATDVSPELMAVARHGRLPQGYWLGWVFLVSAVAVEFSVVVWGSTLVADRTGIATTQATLVGAAFLAGMFAGRLALSAGIGTGQDVRRTVGLALVLAVVGIVLAWLSSEALLSTLALFVAGVGIAGLYPLGVTAALAAAPGRLALAGSRLTLASGVAILAAPLVLGALVDTVGVEGAWGLTVTLAVVALALSRVLPHEEHSSAAGA